MRKPLIWLWGLWILVGLSFEFWGISRDAPDDTFSEFTWYVVRGQTIGGFIFLTGLLIWLVWWFPGHIRKLKGQKKVRLIVLSDALPKVEDPPQLEYVEGPTEPGAPVQKGQPYIVGEHGPEWRFGRIEREDH